MRQLCKCADKAPPQRNQPWKLLIVYLEYVRTTIKLLLYKLLNP